MTTKLCKDCKWYLANRPEDRAAGGTVQCANPGNQEPDYVNGGTKHNYKGAEALRINPRFCGPDAAWFEPSGERGAA